MLELVLLVNISSRAHRTFIQGSDWVFVVGGVGVDVEECFGEGAHGGQMVVNVSSRAHPTSIQGSVWVGGVDSVFVFVLILVLMLLLLWWS